MADPSKHSHASQIAIVIGVVLIVLGLWNLGHLVIPTLLWERLVGIARALWGIVWPCAFVAAGAYLLWAAKKGKLAGFVGQRPRSAVFRRSRADRRLFGVCGGIAYYFGVDSTVIRIITVLLLFATPPTVALAYVLLALLVPQE